MHVELMEAQSSGPPLALGCIELDPNGNVRTTSDLARSIVDDPDLVVIPPGKAPVTPSDGERYIAALPHALRSPYLYAVLHD